MERKCLRGLAGILLCLLVTNGCMTGIPFIDVPLFAYGLVDVGYKSLKGTLPQKYLRPMAEVDQAVQNTCHNLGIKISERQISPTGGMIVGVDANGDKVTIILEQVKFKNGMLGTFVEVHMRNRKTSQRFHEQLAMELKRMDQAAEAVVPHESGAEK